jgi:hypothetical protein
MLTIESDEHDGYYMLVDDGIGMCKSKSRNVLVRVRDALNAIRGTGLFGLTVENIGGAIPTRGGARLHGVALALSGPSVVVRMPDGKLDMWSITDCRIVEPERPDKPTKFNDPEDIRR